MKTVIEAAIPFFKRYSSHINFAPGHPIMVIKLIYSFVVIMMHHQYGSMNMVAVSVKRSFQISLKCCEFQKKMGRSFTA